MSPPADLWTAPRPASDQELEQHKLPCDVLVGKTLFRRGTSLLLLVKQHRDFYEKVYPTDGNLI